MTEGKSEAKGALDASLFNEELDGFTVRLPGNRNARFSDDQALLDLVGAQYRDWKEQGRITSVPVARVPKVFLPLSDFDWIRQKGLQPIVKGETGEINVYRLFVESSFNGEPGMIVFPNFDGSHVFKKLQSKSGKVEIDMVLLHSKKGIFMFNVKNENGKKTSPKKIKQDIEKHKKILQMVYNYGSKPKIAVPIHSVVATNKYESETFRRLLNETENSAEKVIFFNHLDLNSTDFAQKWVRAVSEAGIEDITWNESLDRFVARLVSLASTGGTAVLIHENLQKGMLHAGKKEVLRGQVEMVAERKADLADSVIKHSTISANEPQNARYINWTREQLAVLAEVFGMLTEREKGMRILVTGGKGSGKTLLLKIIVKMACDYGDGNILICEGTFKSSGLLKTFQTTFTQENISGK